MGVHRLGSVRVGRAQGPGDPGIPAKDDRDAELAAAHVAHVSGVVHKLVEGDVGEAEGHELDDRAQANHRRADADAGEAVLGDRGVDDPPGAELVEHPLRNFVSAVVFGHFLAHEEDALVALHLLGHGGAEGLAVREYGHVYALTPGGYRGRR